MLLLCSTVRFEATQIWLNSIWCGTNQSIQWLFGQSQWVLFFGGLRATISSIIFIGLKRSHAACFIQIVIIGKSIRPSSIALSRYATVSNHFKPPSKTFQFSRFLIFFFFSFVLAHLRTWKKKKINNF